LVEIIPYENMAKAIKTMIFRVFPAIGIAAAAYGICLGAREIQTRQVDKFLIHLELSTIDFDVENGDKIPMEESHPSEIYQVGETQVGLNDIGYHNRVFDIMPTSLIDAIFTEKGFIKPNELLKLKKG
jgi:methylthioribose-1-phosphate isomerase